MRSLKQTVFPRWQQLSDELGFDAAFSQFGPYAGAHIKVRTIDRYTVESSMPLVESNTNYVGTHFGGSLYSMCDPFFMFLLMRNLGEGYMVWDKAATVEFIKPGTGTVTARFHIPSEHIEALKVELAKVRKLDRIYRCEVKDESGDTVARLTKTLYIRLMKRE
jgi:acyl-coenzyme A thioesterase PaaI-like protein